MEKESTGRMDRATSIRVALFGTGIAALILGLIGSYAFRPLEPATFLGALCTLASVVPIEPA